MCLYGEGPAPPAALPFPMRTGCYPFLRSQCYLLFAYSAPSFSKWFICRLQLLPTPQPVLTELGTFCLFVLPSYMLFSFLNSSWVLACWSWLPFRGLLAWLALFTVREPQRNRSVNRVAAVIRSRSHRQARHIRLLKSDPIASWDNRLLLCQCSLLCQFNPDLHL